MGAGASATAQQAGGHPDVVLKDKPSPSGQIVAKIPNGQQLTLLADHGDYVHVRWQGKEGFARVTNLVRDSIAQSPDMSANEQQADGHPDVVLRSTPNPSGRVVAKVPNGEPFTILGGHGDYIQVRWQGREGFARVPLVVQVGETVDAKPVECGPYDNFNDKKDLFSYVTECGVRPVRFGYLRQLAKTEKLMVRHQELPPEAFSSTEELRHWILGEGDKISWETERFERGLFSVSHPWLASHHPDPHGLHLQEICKLGESHLQSTVGTGSRLRPYIPDDAPVFFDFLSLPQLKKTGSGRVIEGRTAEEDQRFKQCLKHMHVLYAHLQVNILCLDGDIPSDATSKADYHTRGWCGFEFRCFSDKDPWCLECLSGGVSRSFAPMLPEVFLEESDKQLTFTTKADKTVVGELYRKVFQAKAESTEKLKLENPASKSELLSLVAALPYYNSLDYLKVGGWTGEETDESKQISAAEITSFAEQLAEALNCSAAPKLRELFISIPSIGGGQALASRWIGSWPMKEFLRRSGRQDSLIVQIHMALGKHGLCVKYQPGKGIEEHSGWSDSDNE